MGQRPRDIRPSGLSLCRRKGRGRATGTRPRRELARHLHHTTPTPTLSYCSQLQKALAQWSRGGGHDDDVSEKARRSCYRLGFGGGGEKCARDRDSDGRERASQVGIAKKQTAYYTLKRAVQGGCGAKSKEQTCICVRPSEAAINRRPRSPKSDFWSGSSAQLIGSSAIGCSFIA